VTSHVRAEPHNVSMENTHVQTTEAATNKPVMRFRNRLVTAAVWQNAVSDGVMHTVTFDRAYRVGDDWRTSTSFAAQDLVALAKVALEAHTWISRQQSASWAAELPERDGGAVHDEPGRDE
jgi:hypothetical protein